MIKSGVILDERELQEAVKYFSEQKALVFDVEAQGPNRDVPHLANLSWISLATKGAAIVVPFGHPIGDKIIEVRKEKAFYKTGKEYNKSVDVYEPPPAQISTENVFEILEPLFFDESITLAGHDVVYDLTAVSKYWGAVPYPPYFCTKTGFWLLNENRRRWGLKEITEERYGVKYDMEGVGACVEKYPFSTVAYYSFCDAKYDWLHYLNILREIEEQNLHRICNLEMQVLNVMVGMRLTGAMVDVPRLKELDVDLSKEIVLAEGNVYTAAGKKFNLNSPKQKQVILYGPKKDGNQGLKPWKLTKTGLRKKDQGLDLTINDYSTDDDVLSSYPENVVCNALRAYGDLSKLHSTYVRSWLGDDEKPTMIFDEHIHAGFQQYGTVTGRFSCRAPNLQNIPRPSSELGRLVRGAFIAGEGNKLVVADYGQIELVVLAHYIGEGALYDGFLTGIDPHTMTAAMVLGKDPADVLPDERQRFGKTMNFAVVYGAGINKVAALASVMPDEAKSILKSHAKAMPEIGGFKQAVIDLAASRQPVPYITTLLGRKRRIPQLNTPVDKLRMSAERQTFNSLIQGGAADLIKLAMVRVDGSLPPEIQLTLTVHDEIVLSAPDSMAQEASALLAEAMTGEGIQRYVKVPLNADVKIVSRWSDAK